MSNLIEIIPGKVSGALLVKGTRIPVQALLDNFNAGVTPTEIADLYEGLDPATVEAVIKEASARPS